MQLVSEFERLHEWEELAKKLVDKYPERYGHVDVSKLVAYLITNKEETEVARPYEMQSDKLPMRLTNQFDYFIWFKSPEHWHDKPKNVKVALVVSALERIDPEKLFHVAPLDYRDQAMMVRTYGVDWFSNPRIPDALEETLEFKS